MRAHTNEAFEAEIDGSPPIRGELDEGEDQMAVIEFLSLEENGDRSPGTGDSLEGGGAGTGELRKLSYASSPNSSPNEAAKMNESIKSEEKNYPEAKPKMSSNYGKNLAEFVENSPESKEDGFKLKGKSASHEEAQLAGDQFEISWQNLDFVVESKWYKLASQRKPILDKLSGRFKSGELSAVLGPSGAGKSTFIDCLIGKHERGVSGSTRVTFADSHLEGERRRKRPLRIALIPQEDHLLDSLTVMETFMFASKIKNAHLTYEEDMIGEQQSEQVEVKVKVRAQRKAFDHFANVQRVIQQLNLSSCANLKCAKLSGGQYKRVSIGQELLSRPDLLVLDEPTSGLDSVTCFQTIKALRNLIDTSPYPMAIVATIHQPDVEVFGLFHKAYVIASGGRAIYEGPTNLEAIFSRCSLGLELVEARRAQPAWSLMVSGSDCAINLDQLRAQLAERSASNPARLIVEVAANEFGFEITGALNELQQRQQQQTLELSPDSEPETSWLADISAASCSSSSSATVSPNTSASLLRSASSAGSSGQSVSEGGGGGSKRPEMRLQMRPSVPFDYLANSPSQRRQPDLDRLLNVNEANLRRRRSIWVYLKHIAYHTRRSWTTIVRDPMLFSVQVILHIFVPLLISYSFQGQQADACPRVGPLDLVDEAYRQQANGSAASTLDELSAEVRGSFENLGYMFFQIYVILFAAVCATSLTYPLAMHVLLREFRNGWYSMSSYFLGRTLADLPVPTFNVFLAMAISYHLTGQPSSEYGWRFIAVASLTVLATLVAQTQGLMFGALLMNLPQSAVFVAPASTAPLVVVSGFLFRIRTLPMVLQVLSKLSYFTYLLNGFIIARYGFNRCPCKEEDFQPEEEHQIPGQARTVINVWIDTFAQDYANLSGANNDSLAAGSGGSLAPSRVDLIDQLMGTLERAKTFGYQMTNCSQVKPFSMLDYDLEDSHLKYCFLVLIIMLLLFRLLTYLVLSWKIGSSI